jgi:hypothetical protein
MRVAFARGGIKREARLYRLTVVHGALQQWNDNSDILADKGECVDMAFIADNSAYSNILIFVTPCAEHPVYLRYCTSTMLLV